MQRFAYPLLIIVVLFLTACVTEPDSKPTPLPTAVPPGNREALGSWGVEFRHEFPKDFWPEGVHRYAFNIQCPQDLSAINLAGEWRQFLVSADTGLSTQPVYLRLNGFSQDPLVPVYLPDASIHPNQDTVAAVTLLGLSQEAANRASEECDVLIAWDNFPPQEMTPQEPYQP